MQTIEKKVIWEGGFLRTLLLTYSDSAGRLRTWEAVERVNCSGIVAIVPVTVDGEVLLVRQFRPVLNKHVVEFPAGLNDREESPEEAARRELVEETGYTCERLVFLAEGPISSGLSTEVLTVFYAEGATPAPARLKKEYPPDESESIEIIHSPFADVYETIERLRRNGDCIDLKIYGFLELARRKVASSK